MRAAGFGLSIVALGVAYFTLALGLPMYTLSGPGPGVFPVGIAGILVLAGALAAWKPDVHSEPDDVNSSDRGTWWAPGVLFASLVIFCLLFQRIGYVASGIFVVTAALRSFSASWLFSLAVSVVSVLVTYLVFVTLLGLQLPHGSWLP
jgi:putative tricarboxylic transport membrane protein